MRGTAIVMNRSRNSYIPAPRSVTLQPTPIPSPRLKFAIAFLAFFSFFWSFFWPLGACCAGSAPGGAAAESAAPACFGSRSFVSAMALLRFHARNRLAGLDRDPLRRSIFVQAPPDPRRLSRLGVEQHHLRRGQRSRQLDDAALLVRRGPALALFHDVHAPYHAPERLG